MTSSLDPGRCAPAAERRGGVLPATAGPVARWLLVEQPGGRGRDALRQSLVPAKTAARLSAAAAESRVRVVLIRRPGRSPATDVRAWAYVDSRPGQEQVRWGGYQRHTELLDALDGTAGRPSAEPVYLVCTHGRHDTCCAMRGRPLARALARLRPGQVWECSHIGGDRFAANVVVLPEGLYYGHVSPESAADIVTAYDAGEVVLRLLRGRSSLAAPVQAAQHHARLLLDERRIAALPPLRLEHTAAQRWRVTLARDGQRATAVVHGETAPPVHLTCSSAQPESVRIFRVVDWFPGG